MGVTLLKTPPRNSWDAVLTQVILWSFRRFCVAKLSTDEETDLWEDSLDLVTNYAPSSFHPVLPEWLAPEKMSHLHRLSDLDTNLRVLISDLQGDKQEEIADYLDVLLSAEIETWLGTAYAPYSLFPTPEEPDDSIDATKLNAVVLLLRIQRSIQHRKTRSSRVKAVQSTPIKTQIRKTRRRDKNGTLPLSQPRKAPSERQVAINTSECEERQGDKGGHEERQVAGDSSHTEGGEKHNEPQVHAEPVLEDNASKEDENKDTEKEEA